MNANVKPCPACGHQVSRRAESCPQCGEPIVRKESTNSKVAGWLLLIFIFIPLALLILAHLLEGQ